MKNKGSPIKSSAKINCRKLLLLYQAPNNQKISQTKLK